MLRTPLVILLRKALVLDHARRGEERTSYIEELSEGTTYTEEEIPHPTVAVAGTFDRCRTVSWKTGSGAAIARVGVASAVTVKVHRGGAFGLLKAGA